MYVITCKKAMFKNQVKTSHYDEHKEKLQSFENNKITPISSGLKLLIKFAIKKDKINVGNVAAL